LVDNPAGWAQMHRLAWFEAHGAEFIGAEALPATPLTP
jgi:hypothetical protein